MRIKPFLKCAGGKGGLLPQIRQYYPSELLSGKIDRYFEGFLGGGAVLLDILQNYQVTEAFCTDTNRGFILTYQSLLDEPSLLEKLSVELESIYRSLDFNNQREFYNGMRDRFNQFRWASGLDESQKLVEELTDFLENKSLESFIGVGLNSTVCIAAINLFINHTCFNGLFRVSQKNKFNSSWGKYKNPTIYNTENIKKVQQLFNGLDRMIFERNSYDAFKELVNEKSFVYLDPPYQPLTEKGKNFVGYSATGFSKEDQINLAAYFRRVDLKGAKVMLSNSDPEDNFLEELYAGFSIYRIQAARSINCEGSNRGEISELLITNY